MRRIVCYDVVDDRRRSRLHARLKAWLVPVQKSVLEGHAGVAAMQRIVGLVHRQLDLREDRARLYSLCPQCAARAISLGPDVAVPDPDDPVLF